MLMSEETDNEMTMGLITNVSVTPEFRCSVTSGKGCLASAAMSLYSCSLVSGHLCNYQVCVPQCPGPFRESAGGSKGWGVSQLRAHAFNHSGSAPRCGLGGITAMKGRRRIARFCLNWTRPTPSSFLASAHKRCWAGITPFLPFFLKPNPLTSYALIRSFRAFFLAFSCPPVFSGDLNGEYDCTRDWIGNRPVYKKVKADMYLWYKNGWCVGPK
eukprot:1058719-Amorphochlora_amoeboformis.AAC.1